MRGSSEFSINLRSQISSNVRFWAIVKLKHIRETQRFYKILWKDTGHFRPNNRTFWTFQIPNSQTWGCGYNSNTKPNIAIKLCKNRFQKCPKNYTIIKTLKNGKQTINFNGKDGHKAVIVTDKNGKVEKLIEFRDKDYTVFDGIDPHNSNFLKVCSFKNIKPYRKEIVIEKPFSFKQPDNIEEFSNIDTSKLTWKKQITSASNDKAAVIMHDDWYIPFKQSGQNISFGIFKNEKEPATVIKTINNMNDFKYEAGKASSAKPVEGNAYDDLTQEQRNNFIKLFS